MRAPDGRPFVRDGIAEQFRASRKTDDVLSRRLSRQPRIPEAQGTPLAVTRAVGTYSYAGGGQLLYTGWTMTENPYGGDALAPGVTDAGNAIAITTEGSYSFRWKQTVQVTASGSYPTSMQAELNSNRLSGIPDPFWTVVLVANHFGVLAGRVAAVIDHTTAPLWVEAGETFTPKLFWVGTWDPTAISNYGIHLFVNRLG